MKRGPNTHGIASEKYESGKLGNIKLTDVGSRKIGRESVELSVSIVSPSEEPWSLVNLKVPMEPDSLEATVEDLVDFTEIPM